MKFHRYWARGSHPVTDSRGRQFPLTCWGGSDQSIEDARQRADQNAQAAAARWQNRDSPDHTYGYPDRPMRACDA